MKITIAERLAVALMTLSLGVGGVLAVTTVGSFSQPATTFVGAGGMPGVASGGAVSGATGSAAGAGDSGAGAGQSAGASGGAVASTGGSVTLGGAQVTTDQGKSGVSKDGI